MNTIHRYFPMILCAALAVSVLSCNGKKKDGSFEVAVTWGGPKPTVPCWIFAEVRQVRDGEAPSKVTVASPVRYGPSVPSDTNTNSDTNSDNNSDTDSEGDAGDTESFEELSVSLSGVPYGDNYVVVINVKDGIDDDATLLYSGISSKFTLKRGSKVSLSVLLSSIQLFVLDGNNGFALTPVNDLYLAVNSGMFADFEPETALYVSNIPSFDNAPSALLKDLSSHLEGYLWNEWDLNHQYCTENCVDSGRFVYWRIVNPVYFENEINLKTFVVLDTAKPTLAEPPPSLPRYANGNIAALVTFSEAVMLNSIQVDCDGFGEAGIGDPANRGKLRRLSLWQELSDSLSSHRFHREQGAHDNHLGEDPRDAPPAT